MVLNEELIDWGTHQRVAFTVCHELGHVVLGHARHHRRWAGHRAEAEDAADEFAEAITLLPRQIIRA